MQDEAPSLLTPEQAAKAAEANQMLTTYQAGEHSGVSLRTIQLWCESGLLPHRVTRGGHRRIKRADLDALMAVGMRKSGGAIQLLRDALDALRLAEPVLQGADGAAHNAVCGVIHNIKNALAS